MRTFAMRLVGVGYAAIIAVFWSSRPSRSPPTSWRSSSGSSPCSWWSASPRWCGRRPRGRGSGSSPPAWAPGAPVQQVLCAVRPDPSGRRADLRDDPGRARRRGHRHGRQSDRVARGPWRTVDLDVTGRAGLIVAGVWARPRRLRDVGLRGVVDERRARPRSRRRRRRRSWPGHGVLEPSSRRRRARSSGSSSPTRTRTPTPSTSTGSESTFHCRRLDHLRRSQADDRRALQFYCGVPGHRTPAWSARSP